MLPGFIEACDFRPSPYNITSYVSQVEYGIDPEASSGFKPSQFYPDMGVFSTHIEVWSNGVRWLVQNGRQAKVDETRFTYSPYHTERHYYAFVVLTISLLGFGYWFWKTRSQAA
jgi:hypothetical protein